MKAGRVGYEPVGVFLPQGEFSTLFFSETPMSPEHFLLVLQSGDWGVCELQRSKFIKCTFECDLSVDQQLTITWLI